MFIGLLTLRILVSLSFLLSIRTHLLGNSPALLDSALSRDTPCCRLGAYGLSFGAPASLLVRAEKGSPRDNAGKQKSDM